MTIREGFEKARAYYESIGDAEMVAFFDTRLEQNAKKSNAERKPTAKQVENASFKNIIMDFIIDGVDYTTADITKSVPALVENGVSGARVAAMLGQLFKDGSLTREEVKGKFVYRKA